MTREIIIITLLLLAIYFYYQRKNEEEAIKKLKAEVKNRIQGIDKTKLQQFLKDWQTNFPGKKRVLDSLEELIKNHD